MFANIRMKYNGSRNRHLYNDEHYYYTSLYLYVKWLILLCQFFLYNRIQGNNNKLNKRNVIDFLSIMI